MVGATTAATTVDEIDRSALEVATGAGGSISVEPKVETEVMLLVVSVFEVATGAEGTISAEDETEALALVVSVYVEEPGFVEEGEEELGGGAGVSAVQMLMMLAHRS